VGGVGVLCGGVGEVVLGVEPANCCVGVGLEWGNGGGVEGGGGGGGNKTQIVFFDLVGCLVPTFFKFYVVFFSFFSFFFFPQCKT